MKHFLSFFLFSSFYILSFGQSNQREKELFKNYNLIDSVFNLSYKDSSTFHIDKLIQSNTITLNESKSYLFASKAAILDYIHFNKKKENVEEINSSAKIVLNQYDTIYNKVDCLSKAKINYYRHEFLSRLVYNYNRNLGKEITQEYKKSKVKLKDIGYKPERDGLGVGLHLIYGKEKWISFDLALFSYFQGVSHLRINCNSNSKFYRPSNIVVQSLNAFIISYAKSDKKKINDLSFSLIEVNAPLTFIPLRFGLQHNPESNNKNYYYRPGLGLSLGMVSLSYSYNLMLKKSMRPSSEKLLLDFRVIYPIVNYRYRTKQYKSI